MGPTPLPAWGPNPHRTPPSSYTYTIQYVYYTVPYHTYTILYYTYTICILYDTEAGLIVFHTPRVGGLREALTPLWCQAERFLWSVSDEVISVRRCGGGVWGGEAVSVPTA